MGVAGRGWVFLAAIGAACGPAAEPEPSGEPVADAIVARGSVRVIVGVRTPFVVEGKLSPVERANQRGRIAGAQLGARARLTGYAVHLHSFTRAPFMVLRVDDREGLDRLRADPQISSIEEDRISAPVLASSTPVVQAPQAWTAGFTGAGYVVAVIDTGVMSNHDHLIGKVIAEACYSTTDAGSQSFSFCPGGVAASTAPGSGLPCPLSNDGCDHGTHVANIAAGANPTYNGVAKGANLVAIMAGSQFTSPGACTGVAPCVRFFTSDWIRGLERVLALAQGGMPIAAVNMSLGGGGFDNQVDCDTSEAAGKIAIDNLRSAGIPTVIASGNDSFTNMLAAPGCISSALSVGATTDADTVIDFSNSASFLGVLAPGVDVTSAVPTSTSAVDTFSGTSMAAPHVAGSIALLRQAKPSLTVDQIIATLKATGTPITDGRNGVVTPRINVLDAITFGGQVADPTFSVPGGTYASPQSLTLSTTTPGATIYFTSDGSVPTTSSTPYTGPINLPATTLITITARAFKAGSLDSSVVAASYDIGGTIATPTFSVAAGTYTSSVVVGVTATVNTTLHVTTDGSTPTGASPVYTGPITVPLQTTMTIKAIAIRGGWTDSAVASATYVVTDVVQAPQFSIVPGTYTTAQSVALTTSTPSAVIRFTLDGTVPTQSATLYTSPIALPLDSTTLIRARAYRPTWTDSQEAQGQFIITGTVATPIANPPGGTFPGTQLVTLSTTTAGATIRYTTDNSVVSASSPSYTAPIAVTTSTTLRARAFLPAWTDSAELVESYTIVGTVATPILSPPGGSFSSPQTVAITTATPSAVIRYTLDGSPVTTGSVVFGAPIPIAAEASVTIRARAFRTGWVDSAEATGSYTVVCTRSAPTVTLAPVAQSGTPGAVLRYDATITNNDDAGCLPSTFGVTRSGPSGWATALAASSAALGPGLQTTIRLDVTSPASALAADYPIAVTASSAASGMATGNATYTVTCTRAVPTLALAPAIQSGQGGDALAYTATVTNHDLGCAASTFTLASTLDAGWTGSYTVATPSIAAGTAATSTLTVTSVVGAALGAHPIVAGVSRPESAGATAAATYTVTASCVRSAPTLVLAPAIGSALRGGTVQYTASLTNNDSACGPSTFTLTTTLPAGWIGSASPIVAGSSSTLTGTVDVTSSSTAAAGDYPITVDASSAASGGTTAMATYRLQATCVRQPPAIAVTQPAATTAAVPLHYAVHVTNSDHADCGGSTFSVVAAVPPGWTAPALSQTLAPGTSQDFDVVVTPPASLMSSSTTFDVVATNTDAPNFSATGTGSYVIGCGRAAPTLAVTTVTENARYAIKVGNHDTSLCASSSFHVALATSLAITPRGADIAAGPGMDGAFEVTVDPSTAPGDYTVHATVTRRGEAMILAEATIFVTVARADDGGGGGCQSQPSAPAGALVLLGLLFVLRRRRS